MLSSHFGLLLIICFMKSGLLYFVFIAFVGIAGGCVDTKKEKVDSRNYTSVRFEKDTINLGCVKIGEKVPAKFAYTNTGKYPLIIRNVQATCGCTEVVWDKNPLLSQQSDSIQVVFAGENKGYFKKSVFVVCNIWKKMYQLHIVGHVVD